MDELDGILQERIEAAKHETYHWAVIRQVAQNCYDAVQNNSNRQSLIQAIRYHEQAKAILVVLTQKKH